ncbi:cyclin-like protein interacting with PHO85 [Diaporthe australafricana]|uniref:Cyclin-like protein interacting with PHO85 n=1 Tax=Diaporthe australafricana TaxID=127596 RepID=A0ABR3W917_9PEZI
MAAVIGDFANHSGFHNMIATQGLPYSQEPSHATSHYRSSSHSRSSTPRNHPPSRQPSSRASPRYSASSAPRAAPADDTGASRLPSPPDSSSGSASTGVGSASQSDQDLKARYTTASQDGQKQAYMDDSSSAHQPAQGFSGAGIAASDNTPNSSSQTVAGSSQPSHVLPSTASNSGDRWSASQSTLTSSPASATNQQQTTIKVRDLAHVQALARSGMNSSTVDDDSPLQALKYDLSECPIGDVIEMVAALLTKITTTNDQQHDALSRNAIERNASHVKQAQAQNDGSASEHSMSPLSSSVLAFHGKNVPAITILSYLSRIHKYCPTTFEVFLSLLVYFDRMTERVNDIVMKAEEAKKSGHAQETTEPDVVMKEADGNSSDSDEELDEDIADDSDSEGEQPTGPAAPTRKQGSGTAKVTGAPAAASQPTFFVVDSFNIHRLIISGVTCASKFFSDVFYTNSRYAKVGGLPLAELNHLEIQFLLLNDFRLAIQVEDLEAYATMLVEFYAREVVSRSAAGAA